MINETCLTVFDRIKTFKELYFVKRNNCPIFPSALSVFPDSRPNFHVRPYAQDLEVRSFNHPCSLKTKSSQCHYVVMTRSETKFQAPLNHRYRKFLAKNEHLTIKTM